ncbi:MAG TPA: PDGLE domain-containing protein [Methanotrichaceae archaeon]|nr:PDGLE domain-containing protein [Methanotrichaceae archaeon]
MEKKTLRNMVLALVALVVLTPLGLLATGEAFGEWGLGDLMEKVGYAPSGMQHLSSAWNAPMPDYAIPGAEGAAGASAAYIFSAVIGVVLCMGILYFLGKKIAVKDDPQE